MKKRILIDIMSCSHCGMRVKKELEKISEVKKLL